MNTIIGTAGHIDHGKTALVKALTGVDTDRLPEEKRRGITVDLGFTEMTAGDIHFGFVDVPGHEKFVRNMLAGAHGIDIVMLVIAANEGVMPQTREHFDICRLLDVKTGMIVLTKFDLVDNETLELAKLDVIELVADSFLKNAPIITVSSQTGQGVEELRSALVSAASHLSVKRNDQIGRLPIDRSFSVKGFGTVVTGSLLSGEIAEDSKLELLPQQIPVRIRGLQTHGASTVTARPGQRTAVNLSGIDHKDIERGMTLAEAGVLRPTQAIDAEIELLPDVKLVRSRRRVRVHLGTAEILARVRVLDHEGEIAAGEKAFVQLRFEENVVAVPGERFIIRSYSPQRTIAGGRVIDNLPSRHRRKDFAEICKRLKHEAELFDDKAAYLHLLIDNARENGRALNELAARTALRPKILENVLKELVVSKKIKERGDKFYTPHFLPHIVIETPKEVIELSPAEVEFKVQILTIYKDAKLDVPRTDEVIERVLSGTKLTTNNVKRLMPIFIGAGEIVKVSNEFCFDRDVIEELMMKVKKYADTTEDRVIDVPKFKTIAGVSRKYAIPLLEYFDRVNITRRVGEKRVVLK